MAVRPLVTTGLAIASAGLLVAAVATIAPPVTPGEEKVAAEVQKTVSSSTLIDAFIEGGSLQSAIVGAANCAEPDCSDNPLAAAFIEGGSLQALLFALGGGNPAVDGFIEGGVIQAALTPFAGDPVVQGFIDGGVLQAALTPFAGDPVVQGFIDGGVLQAALTPFAGDPVVQGFIDGGALQAAIVGLAGCTASDCSDMPAAGGFIAGGTLQAAIVAAAGCPTPDCSDLEDADPNTPGNQTVPGDPIANGFINGGTLQAGLVAVRDATAPATVGATSQQGTQTLARTGGAPQPNGADLVDDTAGFGGTQKLVDNIKTNSPVFGGGQKAASDPAPVITPPVKKAAAPVEEEGEENEGLVRDSLSFKPEPIIPFGNDGGRGAGGPSLFDVVKDSFDGDAGDEDNE